MWQPNLDDRIKTSFEVWDRMFALGTLPKCKIPLPLSCLDDILSELLLNQIAIMTYLKKQMLEDPD